MFCLFYQNYRERMSEFATKIHPDELGLQNNFTNSMEIVSQRFIFFFRFLFISYWFLLHRSLQVHLLS